jgi:aldehyde:ferredoxin oxidoreductase
MFGNWGRILRVDLSRESIKTERVREVFYRRFLGGVGTASKIIFDEVGQGVEPMDPNNVIVFAVGPYQGTGIPGSGRWTVSARSPLTGIWGESCGGGYWGPEFKRTGFDAIAVKGRSPSPVYIWINDGDVEIKNADHAWGKMVSKADNIIKKEVEDERARSVLIGPAGEKLVRFACVASDHGFSGRSGLGAVMGSKNLKAIVVRGTKQVEIADPEGLEKYSRSLFKKINEATSEFRKYGTTDAAKGLHDTRQYRLAENWRKGRFEGIENLVGSRFLEITMGPIACADCPIGCHRRTRVTNPKKYAFDGYGPEYETIGMIGWLNRISDPKAIAYLGHLCDEYGMDTISSGSMIGFTMECYEKGLLNSEDLDDLEPVWGSEDTAVTLIHKMAVRQGFGDILAEGGVRAAKVVGGEAIRMVMSVKGLELPAHDPRPFPSMAVNYATGQRGACHQRGFVLQDSSTIPEWGISEVADIYSMKEPVLSAARYQDWAELFNSLIQCEYMTAGGLTLSHQIELLNLVTGWDADAYEMLVTAERIFTLQRLFNIRNGMSRKDDTLPPRMLDALAEGIGAGRVPEGFERLLADYYTLRSWDIDGKPTVEKLKKLGLTDELHNL